MSTHRSTWKARERQAAALFGALRQRCSGSSGRDDCSRSDSTHDRLFVETKLRPSSAVRTLFDETLAHAKREKKTPVLMLATKGKPGFLLVIESADLPVILTEYRLALAGGERLDDQLARVAAEHLAGPPAPAELPGFGPADPA